MINRGNVLCMPRDVMILIARYENTQKSLKWSSNVWDRDCRDGDKILCNRCPLKHEAREREGGVKCFMRMCPTENTAVGRPAYKYN